MIKINTEDTVTPAQHLGFFMRYYAGQYPNERFGQAFLNHLLPGVTCLELFYQENDAQADAYIWEHFLKLED